MLARFIGRCPIRRNGVTAINKIFRLDQAGLMASHLSGTLLIDTTSKGPKINKHIFGHFAEHLGRCIYDGFYVGENSPIPNVHGIRKDVIDALRKIKIPNLRWPGGCFADTYHWKDGIGPKHRRPSIVNRWWGDVTEDNSFGTDEFLTLCELLQTEPFIVANVGSGSVQELMDWIQYTNFDGTSPMSDLRRSHGREQPWAVKFWGLGNEAWGCGGNMTAAYYANIYRQYATFMTGWSNTQNLFRIASGPNTADTHWTETLMREIPHQLLEGIGMHYYAVHDWQHRGRATNFTESDYCLSLLASLRIDELLKEHIKVMDCYDPMGKIALVVDEWGTWYDVEEGTNPGFLHQQNTMRDAIVAAISLNIFIQHAGRVRMTNIAQAINVLQALLFTENESLWLSPTYHIFDLYRHHQNNHLLLTELTCPGFSFGDAEIASVSASASVNDQGLICVTIANCHPTDTVDLKLQMDGAGKLIASDCRILTSSEISDHNTRTHPYRVAIRPWRVENDWIVSLPKCSVVCCLIETGMK